jgi:hypothetical protein
MNSKQELLGADVDVRRGGCYGAVSEFLWV